MNTDIAVKPNTSFFEAFSALSAHITRHDDLSGIATGIPWCNAEANSDQTIRAISKLWLNSWSAEYALRITPVVNSEAYLQSSLHWTFPQAYYSVLFSARAFLALNGIWDSNEELIRKNVAKAVSWGVYPESVGFYASGSYKNYRFTRLTNNPKDAETLVSFLESTRDKRIQSLRKATQQNPKTALRSPETGEVLHHLGKAQYAQLSRQIGYTTYFDLMARLRISSTSREVEELGLQTKDVLAFHQHLVTITSHVNAVHEAHVIRAIGQTNFNLIVASLPSYLQEGFVAERHPKTRL